jgi:hypothetical protein
MSVSVWVVFNSNTVLCLCELIVFNSNIDLYLCELIVFNSNIDLYLCELIVFKSNTVSCLCELIVFNNNIDLYLCELIVFNSNTVSCLCKSILLVVFVSKMALFLFGCLFLSTMYVCLCLHKMHTKNNLKSEVPSRRTFPFPHLFQLHC